MTEKIRTADQQSEFNGIKRHLSRHLGIILPDKQLEALLKHPEAQRIMRSSQQAVREDRKIADLLLESRLNFKIFKDDETTPLTHYKSLMRDTSEAKPGETIPEETWKNPFNRKAILRRNNEGKLFWDYQSHAESLQELASNLFQATEANHKTYKEKFNDKNNRLIKKITIKDELKGAS